MNKHGPIVTIATGLALIIMIAWLFGSLKSSPNVGIGEQRGVPTAAVGGLTLDGKRWNLPDERGKVVLLDFWATWCPPCVASIPEMQKVYAHFLGNEQFKLVGVSLDYTKPPLEKFLKKREMGWLQVFDRDSGGELAQYFGVDAIPATFLIDREGKAYNVELDGDAMISEIEKLLNQTSVPATQPETQPATQATTGG